ncbi:MAG: hypothetical protein KF865_13435 [Bdellovibrionaceae bacterium]|nr:hypothetical protein [Pseudobdellovibrionaceae bacterium]
MKAESLATTAKPAVASRHEEAPLSPEPRKKSAPPLLTPALEAAAPAAPGEAPRALTPAPAVQAWLWFGTGLNFQSQEQSVPDLGTARFQNIQGPNWLWRGGFWLSHWGLDLTYKDTPGKMNSSDSVVITNGAYNWRHITTEALYRSSTDSDWAWRFGLQHHMVPFMDRDPVDAVIDIKSNSLTLLTVGVERFVPVSEDVRVEWQMRYQHPVASASSNASRFKVSPGVAFDGSVGGVIRTGGNSRLGLFWYGQWIQYRFEHEGATSFNGDQRLFYSSMEVRYGFEF